ncbi:DUF190 domain-containing protein [Clostridium sp. PL3]|uniref:DUF190 domain-containing protein n=1 Tax=Clostridium thailandense TaxID=2794346 RepID=A0A949X4A7_9CLOT|nr:DUF190 domain-containing protein [Clostridium thailandense]MBV7276139.1 DUF190 domain-containing protein [Clostridium thailandense]
MFVSEKYKMLKIYVSEDSKYKGKSLYHSIVIKLKDMCIDGVTVTRGIEGYGKGKKVHNAKILDLSSSLPIIVEAVDTESNILKVLPSIKEMVTDGKIITLDVDLIL